MKFSSVEKGAQSVDKIRLRSITKKKFNASLKADSVEFLRMPSLQTYQLNYDDFWLSRKLLQRRFAFIKE